MQISRALITFAFVHDVFGKTGDIYQGLMPLFAPLIKMRKLKPFEPSVFAADINDCYAIKMHPFVAEDWAPRLERAGLLHRVDSGHSIVSYINLDPDVPEIGQLDAAVEALILEFKTFISEKLAQFELSVPDAELESAIFNRFSTMEFLNVLARPETSFLKSSTLSLPTKDTVSDTDTHPTSDPTQARLDVLCAAYAFHLFSEFPGKFQVLSSICGGALVSEIMLGLRVPPSMKDNLSHLTVFVDSPLLLDLLDVGLEEARDSANFLLDQLHSLGAHLATFQHNAEEMHGVLHAVVNNVDRGNKLFGPFGHRAATDSTAVIRARDINAHLYERLADEGIDIVDRTKEDLGNKKYFNDERETELIASIRRFKDIEPRVVDGQSIASVLRRVLSTTPVSNVLSYSAIFLTRNTGLVDTAHRYIERHKILRDGQPMPVMSDRFMAGLLFVVTGGAGAEIPKKKLIANCAAAIRPRIDVVSRMVSLLSALSPEAVADFEALMTQRRCAFYLMEQSLGDAELITTRNAPALLEKMKLATAAEVTRVKDEERVLALARQAEDFQRETSDANLRQDRLLADLKKSESESGRLQHQKAAVEQNLRAEQTASLERDRAILEACVRRGIRSGYMWAAAIYVVIAALTWVVLVGLNELAIFTQSGGFHQIWLGLSFVGLLALGALQFWFFPDRIFGGTLQSKRESAFQRELDRLKAPNIIERFNIDWKSGVVTERQPQLSADRKSQDHAGF